MSGVPFGREERGRERRPSPAGDALVWLDRTSGAPLGDQKWDGLPPGVLAASYAQMDVALPPPIAQALRHLIEVSAFGYPAPLLHDRLREAFAGHVERRFGWTVDLRRLSPFVDVMQGIARAIESFSRPGDRIIVPTPAYPPYFEAVALAGRVLVPVPLDCSGRRWRIPVERIDDAASAGASILLLCNPHNPTGAVFEPGVLGEIARVAAARHLVVLSDEIHMDLVYPPFGHVPFEPLARRIGARAVVFTSASKSCNIPGAKCAIAVSTDEATKKDLEAGPRLLRSTPSMGGLAATIAAWEACGPWIDRVRAALRANRDRFLLELSTAAPEVSVVTPQATYLAWLDFRGCGIEEPQDFFLDRARVFMFGGEHFGDGNRGFARFNFAAAPAVLDEMVARMAAAVRARIRL